MLSYQTLHEFLSASSMIYVYISGTSKILFKKKKKKILPYSSLNHACRLRFHLPIGRYNYNSQHEFVMPEGLLIIKRDK